MREHEEDVHVGEALHGAGLRGELGKEGLSSWGSLGVCARGDYLWA